MMHKKTDVQRLETGIRNFDAVCGGGLPKGTVSVIAGPPGSGKTILAQQICFHSATAKNRALYFNTLSEPSAKMLRYLAQFDYFDPAKLETAIQFVDLGGLLRQGGLQQASALIMEHLKKSKPAMVVVDSFKVFDDFAQSQAELRKFDYELAVNLMAWETTALLLGEYGKEDHDTNPLFSVLDGLMRVTQRESSGEQQRFLQIVKMRGTDHSRDEHSFVITGAGIELYAPRLTIDRESRDESGDVHRCKTGISKLDELLGEGIPYGSSLLIGGVAGTGKTVLLLELVYRGALAGEKGIVFSFEETTERLRATARGMGWDMDHEIDNGMVEVVFIPQPDILVEKHLLMMQDRIETFGAKRVAIDSASVFLHKVREPEIAREKIFQLASIIQNNQAVGFLATDIPYGSDRISRFGVEETVVDGVILLSSTSEGLERQRYLEVYKLRNTAHLKGRHNMTIGEGGISVFPRYSDEARPEMPPPPLEPSRRLATGVPGLDALLGGGVLERSNTLVSGSAGIGKSILGLQFILEGAKRRQPGLYVSLEEGPVQILNNADALALPLRKAVDKGLVEVVYLSPDHVRAAQFLTILSDKIRGRKVRRLVLDGAGSMLAKGSAPDVPRQLLHGLVVHFKSLGVTSLFTLEAESIYATGSVIDQALAPVADNLVMLRYIQRPGQLEPALTVVKTRGSALDRGTYSFSISEGGLRLGDQVDRPAAAPTKGREGVRRSRPKT